MTDDLLRIALLLARRQKGKPKQAYLRRSISTAYYSLFHGLAALCADELVGVTKFKTDAWRRTYRSLEHGSAKNALNSKELRSFDPEIDKIADAFISLQQARHDADYDPHSSYTRYEALTHYRQARRAIRAVRGLSAASRVELVTAMLMRKRQ